MAGRARCAELGVGGAFKDAAAKPGRWEIGATAFGEMLPNHANKVSLDQTKKDKWGLPVLKIDCATGENERLMRKDMIADMADMLEQTGVKNVRTYDNEYFPGMGIHEMGTARMGRDPKTSVLNQWNQVWDAPNVFVTDGACMVVRRLSESVAHLHGAHRPRGRPCRERAQSSQPLSGVTSMTAHEDTRELIHRREAIRRVGLLLGGVTLVGGTALLTACERERPATNTTRIGEFTPEEIAFLDEVAETILPETKTPGAKAAQTGAFMALMVTDTYEPKDQQVFRDGMRKLDEASRKANGVGFMAATPQQRLAVLEQLDREQKTYTDARDAARREAAPRSAEGGISADQRKEAAPGTRDGDHRRCPRPLLPHDEGAGAARLFHVGDRLHAGAALRRVARTVRPVRAV